METPVYLFTGFLEAGKTRFIQETLGDSRFNKGERTLLLVCEEGEEEYDPTGFAAPNVYMETIGDESELTEAHLRQLQKAHNAKRVMIEYNGMWQLQTLLDALPMDWPLAQIFLFFDAATFLNYNANMRSLVVDKLKLCDLVAFNRFTKEMDVMDFHKIVRAISRQVDIVYEYTDGSVIPDEIEDPLPFDLNAPVVEIGDRDYAIWYRDLWQDPKKYDGKTVRYKAIAVNGSKLSPGFFALGRQLMTCCVEDIEFAALVAKNECGYQVKQREWVEVEAKIEVRFNKAYRKPGPVLNVQKAEPTTPPEQEVSTYY